MSINKIHKIFSVFFLIICSNYSFSNTINNCSNCKKVNKDRIILKNFNFNFIPETSRIFSYKCNFSNGTMSLDDEDFIISNNYTALTWNRKKREIVRITGAKNMDYHSLEITHLFQLKRNFQL